MSLRLGILRPDRPSAVVATAEARVIRHELERRLGDVTLDLRVAGDPLGPWLPIDHAAWPGDIDHRVDASTLWGDDLPPLTSLFARTVEPAAAEVRTRMLHHLGVLPVAVVVDDDIALTPVPVRPTDAWLMIRHADRLEVDDRALRALAHDGRNGTLDEAFDRAVDEIGRSVEGFGDRFDRALADVDDARRRAADAEDQLLRFQREALERLDDMAGELAVFQERLERVELGNAIESTS